MMELELQFDAFLDSPYFPLSLAENRLAVFYNNDQLFGVCTRAFSLLARAGYPLVVPIHFIQHGFRVFVLGFCQSQWAWFRSLLPHGRVTCLSVLTLPLLLLDLFIFSVDMREGRVVSHSNCCFSHDTVDLIIRACCAFIYLLV